MFLSKINPFLERNNAIFVNYSFYKKNIKIFLSKFDHVCKLKNING